jgi:hypothetical protein
MNKPLCIALVLCAPISIPATAETVKAVIAGKLDVDAGRLEAVTTSFSENQAVILNLDGDTRFLRGLEIELTAGSNAFASNSFSVSFYSSAKPAGESASEWEGKPVFTETLDGKISTIYQIPFSQNSGLRRTPYVNLLPDPVVPTAFPLLLSVTSAKPPADSAAPFHLSVKPIFGDMGAVKLAFRYPPLLSSRPVSVLIDDEVVDDINTAQLIREGEHQLLVVSEDYRAESRRFLVDRGKTTEILITLKDTTPLLLFETPDRALIFINNQRVISTGTPHPIAPGIYDIKIQVSDYTIIKTVQIQKGKTYRVTFTMDMSISEAE